MYIYDTRECAQEDCLWKLLPGGSVQRGGAGGWEQGRVSRCW